MPNPRTVAFQGSREAGSAYALINARWSRTLAAAGYLVADYAAGAVDPDVLIHHDFATRFLDFIPPPRARSVAVRTWDFGPLPPAWAAKINREFAQYWAHTSWIAEQARVAGIDPARIRIVPHGVDSVVFRPKGPRYPLVTEKSFRFLFVGGVSLRKGTDILLEAYRKAFTAADDVCLVLKDHSGDLFYRDDRPRDRIKALQADPRAPAVEHVDRFLPELELAALYRTADVAVFPYRAEGFCLPILEAMACGTPAIVPEFGACLDFCDAESSYPTRVRRIKLPAAGRFKVALGFEEELAEVDFCEIPVDRLAESLRATYAAPVEERRSKAVAGVERAHGRWTWDHAIAIVLQRIAELLS